MNTPSVQTTGRELSLSHLLIRNTFFNLATQVIVVAVAIGGLPLVVRGLSSEGFGLLSLVWAFVGYFTLLDFGISRAITKFLAEALARHDGDEVRKLIGTSMVISVVIGLLSAVVIIVATPALVNDVFKVVPSMVEVASGAFILSAVSVPFMLVFGILKGVQMALQRFDWVSFFQGIMGIAQWGGSVALIWMGYGLKEIILLTVAVRVLLAIGAFLLLPSLIDYSLRGIVHWDWNVGKKLFSFGGWLTISQVISPLFLYLDRILIGLFLSLSAVAYYTVPQEALTRILIIPLSLTATLFPALSEQSTQPDNYRVGTLYYRSIKYILIFMLPIVLLFVTYAPDVLTLWLGADFASHSTIIFQVLAVGLLFNTLAQVPTTALHAFGRPDLTAKFHLLELPIMVGFNLALIPWLGILGAAITWSARVSIDFLLLILAANRCVCESDHAQRRKIIERPVTYQALFLLLLVFSICFVGDVYVRASLTLIFVISYGASIWFYGFDDRDRKFLLDIRTRMFGWYRR